MKRSEPGARCSRCSRSRSLKAEDFLTKAGADWPPFFFARRVVLESRHGETNRAHQAEGLRLRAARVVTRARRARAVAEGDGVGAAQRDADRRGPGSAH